MACCLTAPSHYLNQYWHPVNKVMWHSLRAISQQVPKLLFCVMNLKIILFKTTSTFPRGKWVNQPKCCLQNYIHFVEASIPLLMQWRISSVVYCTLVQLMVCCLIAPSHYLNQWWSIANESHSQLLINSLRPSGTLINTIIDSDNGLSPGQRQAIIWTNAGILLIGLLGTNFSEILIKIYAFSFKKMHLKVSSGKWRPFYLGLNVLIRQIQSVPYLSGMQVLSNL